MTKRNNGLVPIIAPIQKSLDSIKRKLKARTELETEREKSKSVAAASCNSNASSPMRYPPIGDEQSDLFVPSLSDLGARDNRCFMDVAPFRLSKNQKRAGETIRYKLSTGYVEIKSGPDGMATIWDYDIVLMIISFLTEAMNRYRDGKEKKPGRLFTPHVSDILNFCRKGDGSRQFNDIIPALDRLKGTIIKSERKINFGKKHTMFEVESEGLISRYRAVSYTHTGKVASVEIEVPYWIYREVAEGKGPDVLTMHPDYFQITSSIGRFIYRLARSGARKTNARWGFHTIYERSGSSGTFKKFTQILRKIIAANDLPEYTLQEEQGKHGHPILVMQHR